MYKPLPVVLKVYARVVWSTEMEKCEFSVLSERYNEDFCSKTFLREDIDN